MIHWPGMWQEMHLALLDIVRVMITQLPACPVHRNIISTVNFTNIYVYLVTFLKYCY